MSQLVFLGAGSVVFTRQLLADLLRFDDLRRSRLVLHDIDPERLDVARGTARAGLRAVRRDRSTIIATLDRREALDGADFVDQHDPGRRHRRHPHRPRDPGRARPAADDRRHDRRRRGLPRRCARSRCFGHRRDMRELCPDAWFLNYTNPMAMNVWWMSVVAPELKAVGLCHSVYWTVHDLCELIGVPLEDTHYRAAGRQPPGLAARVVARRRGPLPAAATRRSRPTRSSRAGCASRSSAASATTRPRPASTPPSTCSWFLRSRRADRALPAPAARVHRHLARRTSPSSSTRRRRSPPASRSSSRTVPPSTRRRSSTRSSPAPSARSTPTCVNRGLIDNLPQGAVVEVPARVDATGVHPLPFGAIPPQGAALNRTLPLGRRARRSRRPAPGNPDLVRQAVLADPNASSTLTPEQIWALCDELTAAHADLLPVALGGHLESPVR